MKNFKKNNFICTFIICIGFFNSLSSKKDRDHYVLISPNNALRKIHTKKISLQPYIIHTKGEIIAGIAALGVIAAAAITSIDCVQQYIMQHPGLHWLLTANNFVQAKINMMYNYLNNNDHVRKALDQYIEKVKAQCLTDKKLQEHALLFGVPYRYIKRLNELKRVHKNSTIFDVIACEKSSDEQISIFLEDGYILCALALLCNDYKKSSTNSIYSKVDLKPLKELSELLRPVLTHVGDITSIDLVHKGFLSSLGAGILSFGENYANIKQYQKDTQMVGANIANRLDALEQQKRSEEQNKKEEIMWDFIIQPMIKNIKAIIEK